MNRDASAGVWIYCKHCGRRTRWPYGPVTIDGRDVIGPNATKEWFDKSFRNSNAIFVHPTTVGVGQEARSVVHVECPEHGILGPESEIGKAIAKVRDDPSKRVSIRLGQYNEHQLSSRFDAVRNVSEPPA